MKAIGIYCEEINYLYSDQKADEAYLIKAINAPTDAYLNIEAIIDTALARNIDAIHRDTVFWRKILFLRVFAMKRELSLSDRLLEVIDLLGNKVNAKRGGGGA
jgi:pyruvate carboxylase